MQDEIAGVVVNAIRPAIGHAEQQRVMRKPPNSLSAWETYQRGLWHLLKGTPDDTEQARRLFMQATDIDPGFALFERITLRSRARCATRSGFCPTIAGKHG